MPEINKPYASGTPISWGSVSTGLSSIWSSVKSVIPFTSSAEPPSEGVYTDFLGNVYAENQVFSGLGEKAQQDRIVTQSVKDPSGQSGDCSWYNLPCKISNKVSAVTASAGEFVSSTLYKTLAIVVVVGIVALFLLSYVQTKGAQLAK